MRKTLLLLLTCTLAVPASLYGGAEVEQGAAGLTRVTPLNSTYYNPTGIRIGDFLYLYLQGGDGSNDQPPVVKCNPNNDNDPTNDYGGDTIIAYRAPVNPATGEVGAFTRVGRISPSVYAPTNGNPALWASLFCPKEHPPASFGPGQVFQSSFNGVAYYHMVADASDTFDFRTVWRAISTDGISWTWYISGGGRPGQNQAATENLTRSDGGSYTVSWVNSGALLASKGANNPLRLTNPIFLGAVSSGSPTWKGFLNFFNTSTSVNRVGAIQITWSSANPPVPTVQVVTSTTPNWTYTTIPDGLFVEGGPSPFSLMDRTSIKSLVNTDRGLQAWGWTTYLGSYGQNVSCNTNTVVVCNQPEGCTTGDSPTIKVPYNQSGRPFWLNTGPQGDYSCSPSEFGCWGSGFANWAVDSTGFLNPAAMEPAYSQLRALPSGYDNARIYPLRIDVTGTNPGARKRYLFSVTNDDNICSRFLFSAFLDMYVVRTELSFVP